LEVGISGMGILGGRMENLEKVREEEDRGKVIYEGVGGVKSPTRQNPRMEHAARPFEHCSGNLRRTQ